MADLRSVWGAVGAFTAIGLALLACAKADDDPVTGNFGDAGNSTSSGNGDNGQTNLGSADDDDQGTTTSSSSSSSGTTRTDAGSSSGNVTSACATALAAASWNFESGAQGWTHQPSDNAENDPNGQPGWPFDPWSQGAGGNNFPCPDGSCWGAELGENYAQCSRGELVSPAVDLSACSGQSVKLQFAQAYDFWTGSYSGATYFDGGIVELSSDGGTTWTVPTGTYPGTLTILPKQTDDYACVSEAYHVDSKPGFVGKQQTASTFSVAVPAAMLTSQVRIRFSTGAGVSTQEADYARQGTGAGWRIDDVKLVAGP